MTTHFKKPDANSNDFLLAYYIYGMNHTPIFSKKDFKQNELNVLLERTRDLETKKEKIRRWQQAIENGRIAAMKEEQLQDEFLKTFFVEVLGYQYDLSAAEWQLEIERSTDVDNKKPDGVLGWFSGDDTDTVKAVIELKSAKINLDKKQNRKDFAGSPVEQGFSYVPKMGGKCDWVIISDFLEIRLYHAADIRRYERFEILQLLEPQELKRFFFLLSPDRLFSKIGAAPVLSILEQRRAEQRDISNRFYSEYAGVRLRLIYALLRDNKTVPRLQLLTYAQRLLDRIIFIAFVRDIPLISDVFRELDTAREASFSDSDQLYWNLLKELFIALDTGFVKKKIPPFNGGLFLADTTFDNLIIRNELLTELFDLVRRYDFQTELDVNILGHIFEQSISDLETLRHNLETNGEDQNPPAAEATSHRKKQGIYYTPEYVTHYIVEQALGGWLDDRRREILKNLGIEELAEPTAEDYASIAEEGENGRCNERIALHRRFWAAYRDRLAAVKVLDPACGSGAFLNQAFNKLAGEWEILEAEWKKLHTPLQHRADTVNEGFFAYGNGRTLDETDRFWTIRKNIVINNLFGVDLSAESVEITKLSLWLKTANRTQSLANLTENIQQGNSLIDDPAVDPLAFRWHERFAGIMSDGGFDVVIGNPPYVFGRDWKYEEGRSYQYFLNNFEVAEYQFDMYVLFWERGIKLLNDHGKIGYVTPNTWFNNQKTTRLRRLVLLQTNIESIADYSNVNVFEDAVVLPVITTLGKPKTTEHHTTVFRPAADNSPAFSHTVLQDSWLNDDLCVINFNLRKGDFEILKKIESGNKKVAEWADVKFGVKIYETGKGTPPQKASDATQKIYEAAMKIDHTYRPYLEGKDVESFLIKDQNRWIKYGENLAAPRDAALFQGDRLLVRRIVGEKLIVAFVDGDFVTSQLLHIVKPHRPQDAKYLLVLLNSILLAYYFRKKYNRLDKTFPEIRIYELESLPIPQIAPADQAPFIEKADEMLRLHRALHEATSAFGELVKANFGLPALPKKLEDWHKLDFKDWLLELKKAKIALKPAQQAEWLAHFTTEKTKTTDLLTRIENTDREIDRMVYALYGLTSEEIAIVEAGI